MIRSTIRAALYLATLVACPLAIAQAAPPSAPSPPLAQQIAALVTEPAVARAHWGVMVTTLDGTPIYALNEAQLFQPASNAKLFTTAAALALLGPDRTFETRVIARGKMDLPGTTTGTLTGNLMLVGGGDANLSGRTLPYVSPAARPSGGQRVPAPDPLRYLEEFADKVAATGLKVVTGDIVGDDTFFTWDPYPSDWSVDDLVWGYGAPVSALSINDNQLQVSVTPSDQLGYSASVAVTPPLAYYTVDAKVRTGVAKSAGSIQMDRAPGSKELRIYGGIAMDAVPDVEEVAIQDPAEYAAAALIGMLEARGIEIKGVARGEHWPSLEGRGFMDQVRQPMAGGLFNGTLGIGCADYGRPDLRLNETVLASHRSVPLREDLVLTNKVSQNLHAELFLRHLGKRMTCTGSTAQGARVIRSWLTTNAGIDKDDFVFFDGSGLSGHDLVTPRATAKLLQYATTQPWFADWKSSLPIGGEDGSLATRFPKPPLKDHIFAKTGTLGEARALSGYLDCASGRTVIFSIMVGNHLPGPDADREVMDKIVAAIAAAE